MGVAMSTMKEGKANDNNEVRAVIDLLNATDVIVTK